MKNLQNLGKALNKAEQKSINGGKKHCRTHNECPTGQCCQSPPNSSTGVCGRVNNGQGLCNGQIPIGEFPLD